MVNVTNGTNIHVWFEQKSNISNKKFLKPAAILLACAVLIGIFSYLQLTHKKELSKLQEDLKAQIDKNKPGAQNQNEAKDLVEAVKKLIVLPEGENPTIATVTDLEKLKGQAFFQNAQIGDKVLIYTDSKKAVLYRPSSNQIVEIAPLGLNSTPGAETSQSTKISVEIRNASGKTGMASLLKQKLSAEPEFDIQKTGNASKVLDQTLIVDLSGGKNQQAAEKLASITKGKVVQTLPEGEVASGTEILILIGKQ
jgi:hypothetical protein